MQLTSCLSAKKYHSHATQSSEMSFSSLEMSDDSLNEQPVYQPENRLNLSNYSYSAREAQTHELSQEQRLHNVNQKLLFKGYRPGFDFLLIYLNFAQFSALQKLHT